MRHKLQHKCFWILLGFKSSSLVAGSVGCHCFTYNNRFQVSSDLSRFSHPSRLQFRSSSITSLVSTATSLRVLPKGLARDVEAALECMADPIPIVASLDQWPASLHSCISDSATGFWLRLSVKVLALESETAYGTSRHYQTLCYGEYLASFLYPCRYVL